MKPKNAYLQNRQAMQQAYLDVGEKMGMQKMWDYVQLALRDPEIMGNNTFGRQRIEKFFNKLKELSATYNIAFQDDKEADYYQEKLDQLLREIWGGEDLSGFKERYPHIKQFGYDKARKGWGD